MSRSRHTDPEQIIARKRQARRGHRPGPRVVFRKPYPGDVDAVSKGLFRKLLRSIPPHYLFGLREIEFLPRSNSVGEPFAQYWENERRIVCYSLPRVWTWESLNENWCDGMRNWGAQVSEMLDGIEIRWRNERDLGIWFFDVIFCHELGHHFVHQYRRKRRPSHRMCELHNELLADLHRDRLMRFGS
ncbi:hypothetical protein KQI84_10720 [bacterium]|nr:hypothetical protein [bacterium]